MKTILLTFATLTVFTLGSAGLADAARLRVTTEVKRPAWLADAAGDTCSATELASGHCHRVQNMAGDFPHWVPASRQRVVFYQPGSFGPIYCGTLYTNSLGRVDGYIECGAARPDRIYLEVESVSSRGFTVGTFDEVSFYLSVAMQFAPQLVPAILIGDLGSIIAMMPALIPQILATAPTLLEASPVPLRWVSPVYSVLPGTTLQRVPTRYIGYHTQPNSRWAAATMEGVDFAYANLSRQAALPRTQWIVNNPFFGAPTTIWTTVHMNQGRTWEQNMRNITHELGHAIYNTRHSDKPSYWTQVADYARNHDECESYGQSFGQYEGFAHAVSSIMWRTYATEAGASSGAAAAYPVREHACPDRGLSREGNVADFYAMMVHGQDDYLRPAAAQTTTAYGEFGDDPVMLFPLKTLFSMVSSAGSSARTAEDMWNGFLAAECATSSGEYQQFCGTERFRCLAKEHVAYSSDLPDSFWPADCTPHAAAIASATRLLPESDPTECLSPVFSIGEDPCANSENTTTLEEELEERDAFGARYRVEITPAGHTDRYRLLTSTIAGDTDPRGTPWTSQHVFQDVPLEFCVTNYLQVETWNVHGTMRGPIYEVTPMNSTDCVPGEPAITSISGTSTATVQHAPVAYATSYRVLYSLQPNDPLATATSWRTGTSHSVWLRYPATRYFRIEARNQYGATIGPERTWTSATFTASEPVPFP